MVSHVDLRRPRPDLSHAERDPALASLEHAIGNIPMIRRARVGRRITLGREYDRQNASDFPYAAMIEFDTDADLRAYLDHPAHHELSEHFYRAAEAALVTTSSLETLGR